MPYVVTDGTSIYNRLREPKFHLLAFSNEESEWQALKANVESEYAGLIDFNGLQFNHDIAETFGTDRAFTVFLRPDNYIGVISGNLTIVEIEDYLRTIS